MFNEKLYIMLKDATDIDGTNRKEMYIGKVNDDGSIKEAPDKCYVINGDITGPSPRMCEGVAQAIYEMYEDQMPVIELPEPPSNIIAATNIPPRSMRKQ